MNENRQTPITLEGELYRDSSVAIVSLDLTERVGPSRWRAVTGKSANFLVGDRLRFGDQSDTACLLGTLNAVVVEAGPNALCLEFEFHGSVLDEMIAAVTGAPD